MTWNRKQGFDEFPSKTFFLPTAYSDLSSQSAAGKIGDWVEQRGLNFARVFNAGHGELFWTSFLGLSFMVTNML